MKHVYGPVPSRRLGRSLGIDTIPLKTCNWNCVYCQLGRTRPLTSERKDYFPPGEIVSEVQRTVDTLNPGEIDWITFVGSGEPCLHASMGWLIRRVKDITSLPVAVITNGSFLFMKDHRHELASADAVLPSLDAGNARLYRKINRAHPDFTFERLTAGLRSFSDMYPGELWIEIMLVAELNDSEAELSEIARVLEDIQPDEIHINLPVRPPVEKWVHPPDDIGLERAASILGDIARIVSPVRGKFDLDKDEDILEAIVGIISRHPMGEDELISTLEGYVPGKIKEALDELETSGKAQVVNRYGVRFWTSTPAYFPD